MSFNTIISLLLIILAIYVCITPWLFMKAVKFGMKLVDKPEEAVNMPIFHLPEKKGKPKMSPEEDRLMQIYANIDRYDGTSFGQKEIVRKKD